jgi:hypothetical protein
MVIIVVTDERPSLRGQGHLGAGRKSPGPVEDQVKVAAV